MSDVIQTAKATEMSLKVHCLGLVLKLRGLTVNAPELIFPNEAKWGATPQTKMSDAARRTVTASGDI